LIKVDNNNEHEESIEILLMDISQFLQGENLVNTNQALIGYDGLFHGFVIKIWRESIDSNSFEDLNKVLSYYYVMYYVKFW
jgi:hypothetical protein